MNRIEFMAQLDRLLMELPLSDRQDAIAYYNDYFDEAGQENEGKVIQELGSPGKVAAIIKADLREQQNPDNSQGIYTERGYEDSNSGAQREVPCNRREVGYQEPKQKSRFPIALVIIIAIATAPIWFGVLTGILGALVGIFGAIFGILLAAVLGGAGLVVGGLVMVAIGIVQLFLHPMIGCLLVGVGAVFLAIGILGVLLFIWLAFQVVPKLFRWFVDLCHRITKKGEGRTE